MATTRRNPAELLTGACVLAVAAGFLAYAVANSGRSGGSGYELHAAFDHIDGMGAGSDVRLAGVKIGTVLGTAIDPKTCLLYTSPSPRDRTRSRMPSSA